MYLIRRGTEVKVRKPDGSFIAHHCRRDIAIPCDKVKWQGLQITYEENGYTLFVAGGHAELVDILVQCPGCGRLL